ncbi:MAG: hypothetical protein ACLGQH_13895 [Acidobacteriota bacterium]
MAARERTDPTTAANASHRLRELQALLGAMRFSGAFTDLERVCPPQSLAAMMQAESAGHSEATAKLLSPCLLALTTIPPPPAGSTPGPAPAIGQPQGPSYPPIPPSPPMAGRMQPGSFPPPGFQPGQPGASSAGSPALPAARKPVAVSVELPTTAEKLYVTPAVAVGASGQQPDFRVTTVAALGRTARITLTDVPVFIEESAPTTTPPTPAQRQASAFGAHPATYRGETPPFALAADLGIGWHRAAAWWVDIQSDADLQAGRFDFSRLDAQLSGLPPGMQVMLTIMLSARLRQDQPGGAPGAAGPLVVKADGEWALGPSPAAYDAFVKALVTRYGKYPPAGVSRVSYWQFENELDLSRARSDAPGYAALQARTYAQIKAVDPKATVLIGGVSGEDFSRNFEAYYQPVLRLLAGKGFDVFDIHFFGRAGDYRELAAMYAQTRRALDAAGFSRIPIWMTETATYTGAPASPPGLPPQSEDEQAAELARRAVYALGLGIRKVFWAMVREGFHHQNNMFDHVGLTTDARVTPNVPEGRPKAAYATYRLLCAKLAGLDVPPTRLSLGLGVFAYRFTGSGGRAVILAWADPRPDTEPVPR